MTIDCISTINFCSHCGNARAIEVSVCAGCGRDFCLIVETPTQPYMDWFRRSLYRAMQAHPTSMTTLMEPNVPEGVFDMLFKKFGTVPPSKTNPPGGGDGKMLAIDVNNAQREIWIRKRVIWEQADLDALCHFESVDKHRARGAAFILPATESIAGGCAVLIPPLTVTHYHCSGGEQKLMLNFGHALLNHSARIYLPGDQSLKEESHPLPSDPLTCPKDNIMKTVSSYPSKLQSLGVQVSDKLLHSASAIWRWHEKEKGKVSEEHRVRILEQWASTSKITAGRLKSEKADEGPSGEVARGILRMSQEKIRNSLPAAPPSANAPR